MRLPAAGKVQYSFLLAVVKEEVEGPDIAHLTCATNLMSCMPHIAQHICSARTLLCMSPPHRYAHQPRMEEEISGANYQLG